MNKEIKKHLGTSKPTNTELFNVLSAKRFSMKDIQTLNKNLTYRTIGYWNEKGFLLTDKSSRDWMKVSFAEYVWILLLNDLRNLEVGFDKIVISLLYHFETPEEQFLVKDLQALLNQNISDINWNKEYALETFTWLLVNLITYRTPITLRVLNGNVITIYGNPAYTGIKLKSMLDKYQDEIHRSNFSSSVSISLDALIKDYIANKDLDNIVSLQLISNDEAQVIEHLRKHKLEEVKILYESGKIDRVELTDKISKVDLEKRIKESFFSDYQKCTFKLIAGKHTTLERTTSVKIKK
jgi:hypothetical protein